MLLQIRGTGMYGKVHFAFFIITTLQMLWVLHWASCDDETESSFTAVYRQNDSRSSKIKFDFETSNI